MPLPEPEFDGRSYRELLDEAISRIPAHNPEWKNFNDSDPGITLLQLFAFLSESIIYRANLIPERNRAKFLNLLGVSMRPAEASRGMVAFSKPKGDLKTITLEKNRQVDAGGVPFRTENGLDVLPVEAKLYYKSPLPANGMEEVRDIYSKLYASYEMPEREFDFYETKVFEQPVSGNTLASLDITKDTVDGTLWLALLTRKGGSQPDSIEKAREEIANKTLTIGILPAQGEDGRSLYPGGRSDAAEKPPLVFEIPSVKDGMGAAYRELTPKTNVDLLSNPGLAELRLPDKNELNTWRNLDPLEPGVGNYPPWLEDSNDLDRIVTWIRIRSPKIESGSNASSRQMNIKLHWVGINAAEVVQRTHVPAERLPVGTGEPDQRAILANRTVIPHTLRLTVNGHVWTQVEDLMLAAPEVEGGLSCVSDGRELTKKGSFKERSEAYTADRETGEIRFGDGIHGRRPPRGAVIQACYDYGGGERGRVGIGSINSCHLPEHEGIKVANPVPTWGGSKGDSVASAEKWIPRFIRHHEKLVSAEDFMEIAWNTPGVDIGRLEVLPLVHPDYDLQNSEGMVTLMVIPENDPRHPDAPVPDPLFLQTMCEYLSPRRILTTELHVRGPRYVDVWISISIEVIPGVENGPTREEVTRQITGFLSPLTGGFEGRGWPLGKAVEGAEISAAATRVAGVAQVNELLIGDRTGKRDEPVLITGLQLPRLKAVAVVTGGDAPSIEEIRGDAPEALQGETDNVGDVLPVPVAPDTC